MEFKFDDTRLSYWHKNKIDRIEKKCCFLTLLIFLPLWLSQQNWASPQGREWAKSGSNKIFFQFCQSYSYVNRKVWYHQIWIPNNLGFMVLMRLCPLQKIAPISPCFRRLCVALRCALLPNIQFDNFRHFFFSNCPPSLHAFCAAVIWRE